MLYYVHMHECFLYRHYMFHLYVLASVDTSLYCSPMYFAGIMLIEMKQLEESLPIFTHLLELYPEDPSYQKQVGIIQRHLESQARRHAQDLAAKEGASKKKTSEQTE